MQNFEFKNWIEGEWSRRGGLITPAIAAKILKVKRQSIKPMKFTQYKAPDGKTLLSYAEVMQRAEDRAINGVRRGRKRTKRKYTIQAVETPTNTHETAAESIAGYEKPRPEDTPEGKGGLTPLN